MKQIFEQERDPTFALKGVPSHLPSAIQQVQLPSFTAAFHPEVSD
jgi:hypothetical protein